MVRKIKEQYHLRLWRIVCNKKSLLALLILAIISQSIAYELLSFLPMQYSAFHLAQRPVTDSISWISEKTPENAVIVSDHSYGWWVAGVAHRPTLSATLIPYLSHSYEVPLARDADFINDASYQMENGIMRIRDTGPFCGCHNPIITVIRERVLFDTVLYINDAETSVVYWQAGDLVKKALSDFREKSAQWITRTQDRGVLLTRYKDQHIEVTKEVGVFKLIHYMSINYSIKSEGMSKPSLNLGIRMRQDRSDFYMTENRLGFFCLGINTAVNIFFDKPTSAFVALNEIDFTLHIRLGLNYMGSQSLTVAEQKQAVDSLAETPYQDIKYRDYEVTTLDYREVLDLHKVSYIAIFYDPVLGRDPEFVKMYLFNPSFQLVYENGMLRENPPHMTWIYIFRFSLHRA